MDLKGQTALVTGASAGIGMAIAQRLAELGADLVITARRESKLDELAATLRDEHQVEVTVLACDLAAPGGAAEVFARTDKPIDILINNAGFGTHVGFLENSWERVQTELSLNLVALTQLTHLFMAGMKDRGRGWILNVSSIGAYIPCPNYATYAAGKAYVRSFTEAIAYEMKHTGVKVCCLCPGGTYTEFMEVAGYTVSAWQKPFMMSAERCAKIGLSALFRGRRNIISGWINSLLMFATRFTPQRVQIWLADKVM